MTGSERITSLIQAGAIRLGQTRAELFSVLGSPEDAGGTSRKYRYPSIYKYGEVQFVFPSAKESREADTQGLLFAYIDDSEDRDEPQYLLGP